jgi:hypothetical protein
MSRTDAQNGLDFHFKGYWQFIALSERAWKNKPIGRLLLYSISSGSEVIRKHV